jgi:hypothetical protein
VPGELCERGFDGFTQGSFQSRASSDPLARDAWQDIPVLSGTGVNRRSRAQTDTFTWVDKNVRVVMEDVQAEKQPSAESA